MFVDYVHCLTAVRSFKYGGVSLQLFQDTVQRLANQCVIVDNKYLHKALSVILLHGDPVEKIIHPPSGLWRGRSWGRLAPETVHPPSLAQPTIRGPALKVGAECRCVL